MTRSIKTLLAERGVLDHVILPPDIEALLTALETTGDPVDEGGGISTGSVRLAQDLSQSPLPGCDFALTLPTGVVDPAPYKLKLDPPLAPTSFHFWLVLARQDQLLFAFQFVDLLPGLALRGAERKAEADGTVTLAALKTNDPRHKPVLVSRSPEAGAELGPALLVSGTASEPAHMRFTPDTDSTRGIVAFGLEPSTVLFGDSQIGFDCPTIVIDDSEDAFAPGQGAPALDPPLAEIRADQPAWRGLLARQVDFYLPASIPFVGGRPIQGYVAIPLGSGSPELVIETKLPPQAAAPGKPARPGVALRIECLDPAARGLSGLAPTLIAARIDLPLDGAQTKVPGTGPITFAAGKPVRLTVTLARDVAHAGAFKVITALTAQGQNGLLSVTSREGDGFGAPKAFNLAAAMATAVIADQNISRSAQVGDNSGVVLATLAAAGATLSSLFEPDSHFVLHGAELESTGHGLPVGDKLVLTLDYSVAARVIKIEIPAALSVSMRKDQPMRIRVRRVRMSVYPDKTGLDMIGLDFDRAEMELENPGAWDVGGLQALFDVVGSRSGRGSSFIEVDLRFKLNLGPISVSNVTIRAALNKQGTPEITLRGLEAGLDLPGVVSGKGQMHLIKGGFEASLAAQIWPLLVTADAGIIYAPPMVVLRLGVDLPAPIPLANSGFGLFGIGGLLGFSAVPDYGDNPETDPVLKQLQWSPQNAESFQPPKPPKEASTFGFDAAVGTLPDLGFSFSAKAGLLITIPDVAVRGALNGRVLMPPVKMKDPSYPPGPGVSFLGFIGVDAKALTFGVLGSVNLEPLLKIQVPLAGHFPFEKGEVDNWYLYLGADGAPIQGRQIGPISARVLPDILGDKMGADAYLMLRGRGLEGWPHGRALPTGPVQVDGFVVAFGFALQNIFGVPPIAWAELYASLDLLLGTKPPTLAGFGRAGGSLHLGPFSLGVEAQVNYMARRGETVEQYFWAEVAGRIELLFFDVEGKVTISYGTEPVLALPDPDQHPLDRLDEDGRRSGSLGVLTDDSYRVIAPLVEDPARITDDMCVWPDAIISLPFAFPPKMEAGAGAQFPAIKDTAPPPVRLGSEMLSYQWHLTGVTLVDVTDEADRLTGPGVRPNGQLAARWQAPRGGAGDVSELLLLSTSGDLWVNRLADGGEGLPTSPLQQTADICQRRVGAERGWAVGLHAGQRRTGLYLPPDRVSARPMVSRVGAVMHHFGLTREEVAVPLDAVHTLPHPFSLDPAQLVAWPQPAGIDDREFAGHLLAPRLRWLDGRDVSELVELAYAFAGQQLLLTLDEAIVDGRLILIVDSDLVVNGERFISLQVFDDSGTFWAVADHLELPDGTPAYLFRSDSAAPVRSVTIRYPVGRQVGIVGLGGITVTAQRAAAAENSALAAESARRQAAAQAGPKVDPASNVPHQRAILAPGRLYRIDVDMTWSGELFKQDAAGVLNPVETKSGEAEYTPRGTDARITTNRRLFFRTAPVPEAKPQVTTSGMADYAVWLRRRQDLFEPEMVERYLAGYEPAQSDLFRFCDDPLRAHFRQDHVAALAKAYGFEISVAVRRTDRPGDEHANPVLLTPAWGFATNPAFLDPVDQLRYGYRLASACPGPLPGATASAAHPLEPETWYELYILAKHQNDLWIERGRLPGVTFRTSRWRNPAEMLAGLGFAAPGAPGPNAVMVGDLVIPSATAVGTAVVEGDDQAFGNTLAVLGLEGWPVTEAPRLSRMWVTDAAGGWRFAGLMIESPEPVERTGRVTLTGLTLTTGAANAPLDCTIHRSDRSRSRFIYLLAEPVALPAVENEGSARLHFTLQSILNGVATSIAGALPIPAEPAFAEDPA